ncbi:MAG: hypothetical protein Q8Q73_12500 [Stagnimonas sp.]|nr:hypothetical protein [Stagnimonas sp.]
MRTPTSLVHALLLGVALALAASAQAETPSPSPSSAGKKAPSQSTSSSSTSQSSSNNPAAALDPALPALGVSRDTAQFLPGGSGGGKDAASVTGAVNSPGQALRDQLKAPPSDTRTQKPATDQGFGTTPALVGGGLGGNPVKDLSGGNVAGAVGAAAAASDTGSTGIAGQGQGAISDGFFGTKKRNGADQVDSEPAKKDTTFKTKDGTTITVYGKGGFTIDPVSAPAESYDKNNKKCAKGSSGPDCELARPVQGERGTPAEFEQFLKNNPALAAQLRQAQSGDGGRTDPGRGDSTAFTAGGAPLPVSAGQRSQNLVGQPGQAQAGGQVAGGGGVDFNGNAGAIDLGPDSTVSAGNRQDSRAADAIAGRQPSPGLPARDCDADGRTVDTADDCPKP